LLHGGTRLAKHVFEQHTYGGASVSLFNLRHSIFVSTFFLCLSTQISFAKDATPLKAANMEVVYASGFYSTARSGTLALNFKGNDTLPSSMTLTVEGRKLQANLTRIRPGNCGDRYQARLNIPNERLATDLELIDYSNVRCRLYVRHTWKATVTSREPDGTISKMELEGDPLE